MATRTVKVNNISLDTTEQDLKEFLTFPGKIEHIEMQSDKGNSQVAFVTFNNSEGAETAVLLSGAVFAGNPITIDLAPEYALPASVKSTLPTEETEGRNAESGLRKAEDVVTSMLAKGFILGKDALSRAKALDEKHQITSTATSKVVSLDQKVGFTEKLSAGTILVNDKVKEMDEKFQVSEKTKSAISVAEQSISTAGSVIMKNRYVLTGASWVTGAYSKVAKAAEEVGQKTREKVLAQEDQGQTEGHVHTIKTEHQNATTTEQSSKTEPQNAIITEEASKTEPQNATTLDQPSRTEPQNATTLDQPSKTEPQNATITDQPSKTDPLNATTTDQSSKTEPQHTTTATLPSKPESQQGTTADQPSNPAATQGLGL